MALSLAANIDPKCDLKDLLEWANVKRDCFISPKSLTNLMQERWVRQALQHYAIEFQDVDELTFFILQQARKVFGILILTDNVQPLGKFYSHGILHDEKLPLQESELEVLFPDNGDRGAKHLRRDILNEQWKFLAPSSHHRSCIKNSKMISFFHSSRMITLAEATLAMSTESRFTGTTCHIVPLKTSLCQ